MVYLEDKHPVPENDALFSLASAGEYQDTDLIPCYHASNPDLAVGSFQAQFIKYGGIVYRFNTPEELGEELFKIDPESKHNAVLLYREELQRKLAREYGVLEPSGLATVNQVDEAIIDNSEIPISTLPVNENNDSSVILDDNTPVIPVDTSTTTPDNLIDTSTTTPDNLIDSTTNPDDSNVDNNSVDITPPVVDTSTNTSTPKTTDTYLTGN